MTRNDKQLELYIFIISQQPYFQRCQDMLFISSWIIEIDFIKTVGILYSNESLNKFQQKMKRWKPYVFWHDVFSILHYFHSIFSVYENFICLYTASINISGNQAQWTVYVKLS